MQFHYIQRIEPAAAANFGTISEQYPVYHRILIFGIIFRDLQYQKPWKSLEIVQGRSLHIPRPSIFCPRGLSMQG